MINTVVPDFITLSLDQLEVSFGEIAGVNRVFRLAPKTVIATGDLPAVILRVGPLQGAIPASAGRFVTKRMFYGDLLVAPIASSVDIGDQGLEALTNAVPYIQAAQLYFMTHLKLSTDGLHQTALPPLRWIADDIFMVDTGLNKILGPGGTNFVGTTISITISQYGLLPDAG